MMSFILRMCLISTFAFMQILVGCNKSQISKGELQSYIMDESNGLYKKIEKGTSSIEVIYKPHDLILEQEIEDKVCSAHHVDSIKNKLNELDYFTLKLSTDGKDQTNRYAGDPVRFNRVLDYLSFQIGNDVRLVHKTDTIPVHDFMYFQGYGINNASEILLVFKSGLKQKEGSFQFLYQDDFFQAGLNEFEFQTQSIKDIPQMILTR